MVFWCVQAEETENNSVGYVATLELCGVVAVPEPSDPGDRLNYRVTSVAVA